MKTEKGMSEESGNRGMGNGWILMVLLGMGIDMNG